MQTEKCPPRSYSLEQDTTRKSINKLIFLGVVISTVKKIKHGQEQSVGVAGSKCGEWVKCVCVRFTYLWSYLKLYFKRLIGAEKWIHEGELCIGYSSSLKRALKLLGIPKGSESCLFLTENVSSLCIIYFQASYILHRDIEFCLPTYVKNPNFF